MKRRTHGRADCLVTIKRRKAKKMDVQALFAKLKTKFPQCGLSDNEILGIATGLFATGLVTDENVDKIVDAQDSSMKNFQSLFDSRFSSKKDALMRSLTEQNEKAFKEKYRIGDDGKQFVGKEPGTEDEKLLAKVAAMMDERLKPFSDGFAAEKAKREEAERTASLLAAAKKAGLDEELAKMLVPGVPKDAGDLDSYWKDKAQKLANIGFAPAVSPSGGCGGKTDGEGLAAIIKAGSPKGQPGK